MHKIQTLTLLSSFIIITFLLTSCMGTHLLQVSDWRNGIVIYELPSFKRIAYFPYHCWKIAHINESDKLIYFVEPSREKATMTIVSFEGVIKKELDLPMINYPRIGFQYAFSPDNNILVYRDFKQEHLYKMDLSSFKVTLINDHFCPKGKATEWIEFISPTKIASEQYISHGFPPFSKSKPLTDSRELVITDLQKDTAETIISTECTYLTQYWTTCGLSTRSLSPLHRYFVYKLTGAECDTCWRNKTYIIDTNTSKIISTPDHPFDWSPDEGNILYLQDGSKVVIDTVNVPNPRVVYEMSPGFSKSIVFGFLDNDHIMIEVTRMFPFSYRFLRIKDIKSGEMKTFMRFPYMQDVKIIEGGKKLIGVVGPPPMD